MFKLEKILISGYALREGIIIDTLQKLNRASLSPNLRDIRYESVKRLANTCNFDQAHCEHVATVDGTLGMDLLIVMN